MENQAKGTININYENHEIVMTRVFDAPRELVYRAYTDPKLITQWWGLRHNTTTVHKLDLWKGGSWRFVETDPQGEINGFHGEFREIVPGEKLAYTFEYEGMPGHVVLDTITFEDADGKTLVTAKSIFENLEDLNGMVQSGMEEGGNESYDRLAELLQTLQ